MGVSTKDVRRRCILLLATIRSTCRCTIASTHGLFVSYLFLLERMTHVVCPFFTRRLYVLGVESNEWMMGTVVWLDGTIPCCNKQRSRVCGSTSKVDDVRTDRDTKLGTYSLTMEFFVLSIVSFQSNLPPTLDTNLHSHTNTFVNIVYVRFFRFLGVIVSSSNACLCYVSAYLDLLPLVSISIRSYVELGSNG